MATTKGLLRRSGTKLTIRGRPRDLVQVLFNGVMLNVAPLEEEDLRGFGSWAARYTQYKLYNRPKCNLTTVDRIKLRNHTYHKQGNSINFRIRAYAH